MTKQKRWNLLKTAFKVAVTTTLVYFVIKNIDTKKVVFLAVNSNLYYIFVAILIYGCSITIASWRSRTFLRSIGINLSFGFNFRLYMVGLFYNVSLPGGVGGDGYKIYVLRKKFPVTTKRLFLAFFFERLSGLWAIGFIAASLVIMIPKLNIPAIWPALTITLGTAAYYLVMRTFFRDYSKVFFQTHAKALALQSLQAFIIILILLSLNFSGKFSPYMFSFLVSTVAANIPVSLGGFGVREYTMSHASDFFGMDGDLAVFLAFTFFLITTATALSGLYFVYTSKDFNAMPDQKEIEESENEPGNIQGSA